MDKETATAMFDALASGVRLEIVRLLVQRGRTGLVAGAIAQALALPRTNLSFHLKSLAAAGLVTVTPEGRYLRYRADLEALQGLVGYLTEACCADDAAACELDRPRACKPGCGPDCDSKPGMAEAAAPTSGEFCQ
jgi:DNA-binding transcriptional ArsR family regulator